VIVVEELVAPAFVVLCVPVFVDVGGLVVWVVSVVVDALVVKVPLVAGSVVSVVSVVVIVVFRSSFVVLCVSVDIVGLVVSVVVDVLVVKVPLVAGFVVSVVSEVVIVAYKSSKSSSASNESFAKSE
jgi:hypothetical protein